MTEKIEIFKLLLSKEYYNIYRHRLDAEIFPEALEDLYESLIETHSMAKGDVTARELYAMHLTRHKTLTEANKNVIVDVVKQINDVAMPDPDVAETLINRGLLELKATRIARAALQIAQGNDEDFSEIQRLIDDNSSSGDVEVITDDLAELLEDIQATYKWEFNLPELNEKVGKIGPEVFGILAGPVNSGKSLMGIHFVFGPNGFAEQGAMCLYIGNEESLKRTMLRGISCYTGLTRKELWENTKQAQEQFNKIKGNIKVIDDHSMTFSKLEFLTKKYKPDIIIIDMLDKIKVGIGFGIGKSHEKLGFIAERAREHANKFKCAVFGLSQTNGDTFGQLTIDQNQLAGSRVDKAANCDLVLTLGQLPSSEEGGENFRRIYVAKSKLEGNGAKISCAIQPELSRLVP